MSAICDQIIHPVWVPIPLDGAAYETSPDVTGIVRLNLDIMPEPSAASRRRFGIERTSLAEQLEGDPRAVASRNIGHTIP